MGLAKKKKRRGGVKKTTMSDQMREEREKKSKGKGLRGFEERLRERGFGSRKKK